MIDTEKMNGIKTYIADTSMITSLGAGVGVNLKALSEGRSGVVLCDDPRLSQRKIMLGKIPESAYAGLWERYGYDLTRAEVLTVACIDKIFSENTLIPEETGFILATAKGNIDTLEGRCGSEDNPFVPEENDPVFMSNMASRIASSFGFSPASVHIISNACISGVSAIIAAKRLIASGLYSSVIVAGVDVQSRFITSGFSSFKSVSESVCRPYDSSRDGLNPGEACGAMLLKAYGPEEKRSGNKLPDDAVIISGGAISNDANHITGPSRTGDGLYFAIRNAMKEAMVSRDEISFLQMHGTATLYNDEMESKAAALAGLGDVPAQSLKSYFGHTMGASGLIESIICAEQLRCGIVFGTKGFSESGVTCPLNVSSLNRNVMMKHCVKTASGFGGSNAAVVLSLNSFAKEGKMLPESGFISLRKLTIRKNRMDIEDNTGVKVSKSEEGDFGTVIRRLFNDRGGAYMKFYKMDDLSKLGYVASDYLIGDLEYNAEEMAVLLENRSGSLDTDIKHQQIIDNESDGSASPAVFVYTLPNISSGEISIGHHIKGENTFFISDKYDHEELCEYAGILFSETGIKYCIVGWLELLGEDYCAEMELLQKK